MACVPPKQRRSVMRGIVLIIVFMACLYQVAFAAHAQGLTSEERKRVEELFEGAQSDFAKRDYSAAVLKYKQALILQPNSPEAWSNLGVAYHMDGRITEAVEALQKALRYDPNLLPANLMLGFDFVRLGRHEEAIRPLRQVLQQDPVHRDALLALASAYFAMRKYDQAVEAYRSDIRARPNDADAWYGMGLCFEHLAEDTARSLAGASERSPYYHRLVGEYLTEQGSGIDAEEAFRRALSLAGQDDEGLHAALGFVHLQLGEVSRAAEEFTMELKRHPGNLDGKLGLAALAMRQDDPATALGNLCAVYETDAGYFQSHLSLLSNPLSEPEQSQVVNQIREARVPAPCAPAVELMQKDLMSPESSSEVGHVFEPLPPGKANSPLVTRSAFNIARAKNQAGQYTECLTRLQLISPDTKEEILLLARCACLSGRFMAAFEGATTVTARDPQSFAALYWRAEGARKLAQAAFQRAMALNPNSWQGHILLGDLWRQRKKWDLAISHYQTAVQLKPTSPAAFLGLATLHWQNGQFDQAEAALQKVLVLDPDNAQANFELGDIYTRRHRFEEALPYLQKTLARNRDLLAVHADLGKAYAALGKVEEAITELKKALPMDRFGDLHYQLYSLYKKQGQMKLAEQALRESQNLRTREAETQRKRLKRAADLPEVTTPPNP